MTRTFSVTMMEDTRMRVQNSDPALPMPAPVPDVRAFALGQIVLLVLLVALIVTLGRILRLGASELKFDALPRATTLADPSELLWGRMVWTSVLAAFVLASAGFVAAAHRTMGSGLGAKRGDRWLAECGVAIGAIVFVGGSLHWPDALTPRLLIDVENHLAPELHIVPKVVRVFDGLGLTIGLALVLACQCVLWGRRIGARNAESLRLISTDLNLLLYLGAGVLSLGVIASGVMHQWVGREVGLRADVVDRLTSAPMIALGTAYSAILLCTYALTAMAVQAEAEALAVSASGSLEGRQKFLKESGLLLDPWQRVSKLCLALLPLLFSGPIPALLRIGRS